MCLLSPSKSGYNVFQKVPEVNSLWKENGISIMSNIDISVAVATDSGLITPIVKDAIGLGVEDISKMVKVSIKMLITTV